MMPEPSFVRDLDIQKLDTSGLDFHVVHGTDREGTHWIVRTPRRRDVIEAARVEARVLRLLAPRLPVAIPDWRVHTDDVIAYPRLDGTPAVTIAETGPTWNVIDPMDPPKTFLDSYARLLAALHAISPKEAEVAGVPLRSVTRARAKVAAAIEATRKALAPSDAIWRRWQEWLANDRFWSQDVVLVHGDLHPGHLLLGADGTLTGVLDWPLAPVTDPSVDLALFYGCLAALEAVLARLSRAGGKARPFLAAHAAERWTAFPASIAEWALQTNNDEVLAYARTQLGLVSADRISESALDPARGRTS